MVLTDQVSMDFQEALRLLESLMPHRKGKLMTYLRRPTSAGNYESLENLQPADRSEQQTSLYIQF